MNVRPVRWMMPQASVGGEPGSPPEQSKAAGEPDVLLALEGVKELVNQFGADRVKRMVDLLG